MIRYVAYIAFLFDLAIYSMIIELVSTTFILYTQLVITITTSIRVWSLK